MIIINQQDKIVIRCDQCLSESLPESTPNKALETARHDGFYVIVTPCSNLHACSGECLDVLINRLPGRYQLMLPYSSHRKPPEDYIESEDFTDNTYTLEFDEFTDADPGL